MKKTIITLALAFISLIGYAKPDFEIPEISKYETADECRKDNEVAIKTARYYLSAPLPDDILYARQAASYLFKWVEASDEIHLIIGGSRSPYSKCADKDISTQLAFAYFSGCVIYFGEKKEGKHTFDMHYFALTEMLNYYEKHKEILGSDKEMEKMLKMLKKGKLKEKEQKNFKD